MFGGLEPSYTRVPLEKHSSDDASDDGTISQTESLLGMTQRRIKQRFTTRSILGSIVVTVWLISSGLSYWLGSRSVDLDLKCLEHTSAYCKCDHCLKDVELADGIVKPLS